MIRPEMKPLRALLGLFTRPSKRSRPTTYPLSTAPKPLSPPDDSTRRKQFFRPIADSIVVELAEVVAYVVLQPRGEVRVVCYAGG